MSKKGGSWFENTMSEMNVNEKDNAAVEQQQVDVVEDPADLADKEIAEQLFEQNASWQTIKLPENLLAGVYNSQWETPSKIQSRTLPTLLHKSASVIVQSQSGTGKTGCFGLGMLNAVDENLKATQCLCLCPTMELGVQISMVLEKLKYKTGITMFSALKGSEQRVITEHIVVGTPGTINFLLNKKSDDNRPFLDTKNIKIFAIDEADYLVDSNQVNTRNDVLKIRKLMPKECRVWLFSATFKENDKDLDGIKKDQDMVEFAKKFIGKDKETEMILIPRDKLTLKQMKQFYMEVATLADKQAVVKEIYETSQMGQSIIFLNTIKSAELLYNQLTAKAGGNFSVSLLHGDLDDQERKKIMQSFRDAKTKVLITTNVVARGVDISQVTHVINFDLPYEMNPEDRQQQQQQKKSWDEIPQTPDYATYLHRIGRTARFKSKGIALTLVRGPKDKEAMQKLINYFNTKIESITKDDIKTKLNLAYKKPK